MVPKHLYFGHAALALVLVFALQSFAASGEFFMLIDSSSLKKMEKNNFVPILMISGYK